MVLSDNTPLKYKDNIAERGARNQKEESAHNSFSFIGLFAIKQAGNNNTMEKVNSLPSRDTLIEDGKPGSKLIVIKVGTSSLIRESMNTLNLSNISRIIETVKGNC